MSTFDPSHLNYDTASQANQKLWASWLPEHMRTWYDLDAFQKGQSSLDDLQLREVGEVAGRRLLHLMCNIGVDTLSWARAGAEVVGVDFTPEAIAAANEIKAALGASEAVFLCANVYQLGGLLHEPFDIVYTSQGVLCWLNDLNAWAKMIAEMLKPGGFFYLLEEHPLSVVLDEQNPRPTLINSYFGGEVFYEVDKEGVEHYEWQWTLGDVVSSLSEAGLHIDFLHEFDFTFYQRFPTLERVHERWWRYPNLRVPLMFSLKATKVY